MDSLQNLTIVTTPGDGNCQFSAIARALRNAGINAFHPSKTSITMQSLRTFMAERLSPNDISDLLETYGVLETCAWIQKIQFEELSAEEIIEYVKKVVASSKPVIYQGDDWSLGILSRELNVQFIVLRDDGTIQGGLPNLEEGMPIVILYFYDMNPNAKPSGATAGHYDLISIKDPSYPDGKTVFTLSTLPTSILMRVKEHALQHKKRPEVKPTVEVASPLAPTTIKVAPKSVPEPRVLLFPMESLAEPTTSEEWMTLVEISIVTIPQRMQYYNKLEGERMQHFAQTYTFVFVRSDAVLRVIVEESTIGLFTFQGLLQFDDPIDGLGEPSSIIVNTGEELFMWFVGQVGKDDALARARVKTTVSNTDVSLQWIDKALLVPHDV